jgi:hypothetical protein
MGGQVDTIKVVLEKCRRKCGWGYNTAVYCGCTAVWQLSAVKVYILLTVHLAMILGKWPNTDAQFFLSVYVNSLHVSSNLVLIIRRINFINTKSGICHSVSVNVSCAGREVPFRPVRETVTDTEWHIPEVVLIKLILLMMSTGLLETCRELK